MPFSRYDTDAMIESYRRMLVGLRAVTDLPDGAPLTSHWPVVGGEYRGDLLVIGQSVFGWIPEWRLRDIADKIGLERVLMLTREPLNERIDPMSWIATNRNRSSPFWRTVQHLSGRLATAPAEHWYTSIAWTNLYPVGPREPAGNPTGELLSMQTARAVEVLRATVDALKPRLVLVLGGPYWWPFQTPLGLDDLTDASRPLMRAGHAMGTGWVIGWHPAGAQRRGWTAARYADAVVETYTILTDASPADQISRPQVPSGRPSAGNGG